MLTDIQTWSPDVLAAYIAEIGYPHYAPVFVSQGIGGWNIAHFTVSDLCHYTGIPLPDAETVLSTVHHRASQGIRQIV